MKFTLKTIYYILVGIFYRKDIRIVNYRWCRDGDDRFHHYPTYLNISSENIISEEIPEAIKRLQDNKNITKKDRINLDRLLFGKEYYKWFWSKSHGRFKYDNETSKIKVFFIWKYWWFQKIHYKIKTTFLDDLMIGKKPDLVYISDYNYAWWNILKFIKKYLMDYSNTIEHK